MWLYNIFSYMLYNMLYTLHNISQRCNISQPSRCSATGSHTQAGISIHILSPKMLQKFPSFLPKISPFWRPQVGIESVSEMANIFSVFIPKFSQFQIHFLSPFPKPFLSPFPIPFLSPFPIPFLSPYPFYPRFCSHPFQSHF